MSISELIVEEDGDGIVLVLESSSDIFGLFGRNLKTGPSEPLKGG